MVGREQQQRLEDEQAALGLSGELVHQMLAHTREKRQTMEGFQGTPSREPAHFMQSKRKLHSTDRLGAKVA